MLESLESKRVLVTGGSSGIGEAIVRKMAEEKAKVAINYGHHAAPAEALARGIRDAGTEALLVPANVADAEGVAGMFRKLDEAWGGLDILINNAGIDGPRAMAWEAGLEDWRRVIEVNLFGAFHCAREALRRMVPRRAGVIVNITSVHEEIAWSGYSAYATAKAAVGMLSKTLAQEAAPHGIRVLSVAPGAIRTPINESVWSDPAGLEDLKKKIPLGRIGEPGDVANMVAVLASDWASYATGRTYFVDGGMTDYPDFAHGG
jgi:NAD(P)-dependent dehydrogenase (short-subunit alcohol dehydrogenase family)